VGATLPLRPSPPRLAVPPLREAGVRRRETAPRPPAQAQRLGRVRGQLPPRGPCPLLAALRAPHRPRDLSRGRCPRLPPPPGGCATRSCRATAGRAWWLAELAVLLLGGSWGSRGLAPHGFQTVEDAINHLCGLPSLRRLLELDRRRDGVQIPVRFFL
jgi:hypothetical protein